MKTSANQTANQWWGALGSSIPRWYVFGMIPSPFFTAKTNRNTQPNEMAGCFALLSSDVIYLGLPVWFRPFLRRADGDAHFWRSLPAITTTTSHPSKAAESLHGSSRGPRQECSSLTLLATLPSPIQTKVTSPGIGRGWLHYPLVSHPAALVLAYSLIAVIVPPIIGSQHPC